MVLFRPGQMLAYGNVGVCQVEAVGTPKFLRGESREYYTLTPVYSKHKEKIYLPTGTAAYLRPPVTPQQAEAYLAEMPALEVRTSRYPKQALLAQHYQELLQSTMCRIICGCSRKSAARSGNEKTAAKS